MNDDIEMAQSIAEITAVHPATMRVMESVGLDY